MIKMEYGSKNNIFGLKIMLKSGLKIFLLNPSIHKPFFFDPMPYDILHNREDLCLK